MVDPGSYSLLTSRGRAKARSLVPLLIPGVGEAALAGGGSEAAIARLVSKAVRGSGASGTGPNPSGSFPSPPQASEAHLLLETKPERWVVKRSKNGGVTFTHHSAKGLSGKEVAALVAAGAFGYVVYEGIKVSKAWLTTLNNYANVPIGLVNWIESVPAQVGGDITSVWKWATGWL